MQATLSTRQIAHPKNVIDIAPRKQPAERNQTRESRDAFSSKLADARTQRANETDKPTAGAQDVAAASKSKDPEAKKVDRADTRDDAATKSDDAVISKKPSSKEPADTTAADSPADETSPETTEAKPQPAKKLLEIPADVTLVGVQAAQQPHETEAAAKDDESASPDAVVVAAALLAASAVSGDAVSAEGDGEEVGTSSAAMPIDPTLVKGAADADAKLKAKQADGKAVDAKSAAIENAVVPTQHGEKREHTADQESGKQQDASLAAPDASADVDKVAAKKSAESTFDAMLSKLVPSDVEAPKPAAPTPTVTTPTPAMTSENRFAADNVDNVVKNVHSQIAAGGNGQMRIRLDPPELGALEVQIKMTDGRMSAAFTTSNDNATQLLSHNLNNLKSSLEASGINVDRIQVRQSSADNDAQQQPGSGEHRRDGSNPFDQPSQRGDQQRKDAIEKMWRKLAYGSDEFDFVA